MANIVIAFLFIIWSCGIDREVLSFNIPQEYGDRGNGVSEDMGSSPQKQRKSENGETITEGDIIVSKHVREADEMPGDAGASGGRMKRQAAIERPKYGRWSKGVNYTFSANACDALKNCFRKAAAAWERDTCINFRELEAGNGDYLYVADAGGYYSHVGKLGGRQNFSLLSSCTWEIGRAIHEIGHALGLYHTHSRYDRDSYVTVMPELIKEHPNEYRKIRKNESDNYGTEYDFGSIMHFSSSANHPTLIPADKNYARTMGSHMLSFTDLLLINKHYGCLGKCKRPVKCENGGFPHPRNCSEKCICPSGYGGNKCETRPKGIACGQELNATSEPQLLAFLLRNRKTIDVYANCTYWIKSPADTVIEIEVDGMPFEFETPGCTKAGVEIKTNKNHTLTGYRFCAPGDKRIKLRSHSNLVPIIVYNNRGYVFAAELKYRYVPKE